MNTGIISDVASPFGGVKESGIGREVRHLLRDNVMTMLIMLTVGFDTRNRRVPTGMARQTKVEFPI